MKSLILTIGLLLPVFASAQSRNFTDSVKFMIDKTTQSRIAAFEKSDLNGVCNAINSPAGIDTMVYYISFESFDNEAVSKTLYTELTPFYARSLESIYRQGLPSDLHDACLAKNSTAAFQVMSKIRNIFSEE